MAASAAAPSDQTRRGTTFRLSIVDEKSLKRGLRITEKYERKHDDKLIDCVSENILEHCPRDKRTRSAVRLALEELRRRHFGCECKRGKRIHDQIDPEHLHGFERRVLDCARANKRNKHRDLQAASHVQ